MKNADGEPHHRIIDHSHPAQHRGVLVQHSLPGAFGHLFRLRAAIEAGIAIPEIKPFGFVVRPYFPAYVQAA